MKPFAAFGRLIRNIYGRGSAYFDILARLVFAAGTFMWIRHETGWSEILSGLFVTVVLILLSGLLTVRVVPVFAAVLVTGNAFALSYDIGAAVLAVFLILICLFLRFVPDDAPAAVLTAMLSSIGLIPLIPICCGLRRKPSSAVACCSGIVAARMISFLKESRPALQAMEASDYAGRLNLFLTGVFDDTLVAGILSAAAVVILVYAIRTLGFSFCFELSILLGAMIYVLFAIVAGQTLGTEPELRAVLTGAAVSAAAAYLLLAFLLPLEYRKTERLQFEDDHYYYYVRAVPKAASYGGAQEEEDESPDSFPDPGGAQGDVLARPDISEVDFARKLEDSLKDL